ncbi:hypothetical protein FRC12_012634 [Ceratobasidium sp. 428]|nr:hypothetical protein FRC12_012634 [Ceratobasidium sp. 428]
MLTIWRIKATLFSAILTPFVIESAKQLEPESPDVSADILLYISSTLVAISNGQPVPSSSLPVTDLGEYGPSLAAVFVNIFWFSALGISIGVSFTAMLAKKWCHRFLSARSGPYYERARRRQKKWDGIERWKMQTVMNGLQWLMSLALGK